MEADFALLDAARTMNVEALTKIFDLYSRPLYKYAFRLCNDAGLADQIVGDVFSRLLEHLSAGQGPRANLRSYLYETAYHVVIDEARYSHRAIAIEVIDFVQHDGYSTHAAVENRVLFETVRRAIQNDLTEDQRHVVVLRFLEGFSLKETAAIMGKNVGSVKVIQNRAIAALRKALDHQVIEPRAVSSGFRNLEVSMVGD